MANPVGRPTKYNAKVQKQADEYLSRLEELGHVIPSRAGLCCYLGIAKSTSYDWEQQYPKFSDALRAVEVMQEHMTLNGSLANQLNSTIAKLVLSNNHGYSETSKVNNNISIGSDKFDNEIKKAADKIWNEDE